MIIRTDDGYSAWEDDRVPAVNPVVTTTGSNRLAEALVKSNKETFSLQFKVAIPKPESLQDLLDHIIAVHSALVDVGAVSVSFPDVSSDSDPYATILF